MNHSSHSRLGSVNISANTIYYAKVPFVNYKWLRVSAVCESDVKEQCPTAIAIKHYSEMTVTDYGEPQEEYHE